MKKLLFTLLLLPFITFAQLDIPSILTFYEDDNFEYRDNLIFKKSSNSPYTGRVLTYSNSGEIRMSGYSKYGIYTDEWSIYKDTIIRKTITKTERVRVKRSSREANKLAKTRNCLVGYDWVTPNMNNMMAAFKFSSSGTYEYSAKMFGGMTTKGYWKITNQNEIYLEDYYSSTGLMPSPRYIYMDGCKILKIGSTIYKRYDDYNTSESWNSSLDASLYFYQTKKKDTIKDVTESSKTHLMKFKDGVLVLESTPDYTKEWYAKGIKKMENYPTEVLVNYSIQGKVESIYTMNSNGKKEGFGMTNNIYLYYKYNPKNKIDYYKSYILKNDVLKEWNDKGELITDITVHRNGGISSGFFIINNDKKSKKIEISSTTTKDNLGDHYFLTYKVVETIFDENDKKQYYLVWYGSLIFYNPEGFGDSSSTSYKRKYTNLIKLQEFYPNGNLKKEFNFSEGKGKIATKTNWGRKGYHGLNNYGFVVDNLFIPTMKYPLFIGEQKTFYENGKLKCNVVFDDFTKIKKKTIDPKQKYILEQDKCTLKEYNNNARMGISQDKIVYFSYLGEGRRYDENGKKGDKVFWDQSGRLCDKNGSILDDEILNEDINKFYDIWINALKN